MAPTSIRDSLVARWHVTTWGLLLSCIVAAIVFSVIPPSYSSSGTAVLVEPKPSGQLPANPLLGADASLTTITLILVQELSDPGTASEMGVPVDGPNSYSVKWGGSTAVTDAVQQPFITVVAWSPTASASESTVGTVLDKARQELAGRQKSLRVNTRSFIKLVDVVGPTRALPLRGKQLAAVGLAFFCGLAVTALSARVSDRSAARREARESSESPESDRVPSDFLVTPWSISQIDWPRNGHAVLIPRRAIDMAPTMIEGSEDD